MLGRSSLNNDTWFVAVSADLNANEPAHLSVWKAWGPLFDAVMRFAIPTEEPHITKLELVDSKNFMSLKRTSDY